MTLKAFCSLLLLLLFSSFAESQTPVLREGFVIEEDFVTGLVAPTDLQVAPDGRIFITEKGGTVRIVQDGKLLPDPFYTVNTQTVNERGLDGIALDPDFETNGYVYIYYTLPYLPQNVLLRLTASGNHALPFSELELMRFDPMWASWHNGGGMAFDSTGCLLVASGDGTTTDKPQNLGHTNGKIFRLHRDGSIPTDNPFYTSLSGLYRGIAAYGFRNPYTMASSRTTGKVFVNDVGGTHFEEVNEFIRGKNYGWSLVEGMIGSGTPPDSNYVDPVYAYDHTNGCAIVGASFYEPDVCLFPAHYFGKYFFMDYCQGKIFTLHPDSLTAQLFGSGLKPSYNNLEADYEGYLYLINVADGNLARISFQGVNQPPMITQQPEAMTLPVGDTATFEVTCAGDSLTFEWFRDGSLAKSGPENWLSIPNVQLSDDLANLWVRVTNPHGVENSDTVSLHVVNGSRPVILFQGIPSSYAAGDTIHFSAIVTDPDQASVPLTDLTWKGTFHHDEHIHPSFPQTSGIPGGFIFVERYGELDTNVFYSIHLEARDSSGLVQEAMAEVHPQKVTLLVQSDPTGVGVKFDGETHPTPYPLRTVRNLRRIIDAPSYAVMGDSLYQFHQWGDGNDSLMRVFNSVEDTLSIQYDGILKYHQGEAIFGNMSVYKDTASMREFYKAVPVSYVHENWDILNPFRWDIPAFPNDYWSVVWEGQIFPPVSGLYTFYLVHDNKAMLYLNDSLILGSTASFSVLAQDTMSIWLDGGDSLQLKVDYDHYTYSSRVELEWSYSIVPRHKVPFMRMAPPEDTDSTPTFDNLEDAALLFPNPTDGDILNIWLDPDLYNMKHVTIEVIDHAGRRLSTHSFVSDQSIKTLNISNMRPGMYTFRILSDSVETRVLKFVRI